MNHITITQATQKDIATLQQIGKETFSETFGMHNTEANMKKYLEEKFSRERIQEEVNNSNSLFFIVREEKDPIGYLKLNTGNAQTELQDEAALEIERIYVKSSHHGKKVGQLLYEKALEITKSKNKEYVWLAVWEKNPRAISFYMKNGFIEFDKHIFKLGDEEQTDIMMKKIID
jgi:diamine N-acetyltransferase